MCGTVAVVEDDGDLCRIEAETLREHLPDVNVVEWASSASFVASLRSAVPEVVVLDLMMPPPDGWAVLRLLDSRREWRQILAVVVSGAVDKHERRRRHTLQRVHAILLKPVESAALVAAVSSALAARR